MAPRWIKRARSRARRLRQAPQESASASSPTPSPTPSRSPSQPTTRPTSQPTSSSLPTSTDSKTSSLPSLQERLWNEAYDALKANELKLVGEYEKILSAKLHTAHEFPEDYRLNFVTSSRFARGHNSNKRQFWAHKTPFYT